MQKRVDFLSLLMDAHQNEIDDNTEAQAKASAMDDSLDVVNRDEKWHTIGKRGA